jgi:hypothetical protein
MKLLNSSPTRDFHIVINVSTNPTGEAAGRASPDELKPVVSRMLRPWCDGQASWLLRLDITHAI